MALFSGSADRRLGMWAYQQGKDTEAANQARFDTAQSNALAALNRGQADSLAALGQGYSRAAPEYQTAIDRFNPWVSAGTNALGTYQNSLGLNGADGNAAAVAQFQESPGFQYRVDKGTDAVARKASALGALGSGNTMTAIADYNRNEANQEYGGWQDRLNALSNTGLAATGQQANLQQGLGNLYAQQGRDESNIYGSTAGQEAGLYGNFASLGANNAWNGTNLGVNAVQQGQKNATNRVMSGLNFGLGLAGTGLNLLGLGMGGGQTLGGSLISGMRG